MKNENISISQMMIWRAWNKSLPTLKKLAIERLFLNPTWIIYNSIEENILHALVFYPSIKEYCIKHVPIISNMLKTMGLRGFILAMNERVSSTTLKDLFMISWSFWHRCNKWVQEQILYHTSLSLKHALSVSKKFKELRVIPESQLRSQLNWCPPPKYYKLNVDGVLFDNHKVGIDMIFWDIEGVPQLLACVVENGWYQLDPIELMPILKGFQICMGMDIRKLILESDHLVMIKECLSHDSFIKESSTRLIEIKKLQAS